MKKNGPLTTLKDASGGGGSSTATRGEPIKLSFTIRYGDGLSPAEKDPQVFIYLSSPVEMVGSDVTIDLPLDDADKRIEVTIEGRHDSNVPLPIDTQVVFYTTCVSPNDFGADCRVDAGIATVNLADLAGTARFERDLPLKLNSCGGIVKGMLRVETSKRNVKIDNRIRWESDAIASALIRAPTPNVPLDVELGLLNYTQAVMRTEMSFPNTFPETSNVRIPIYYGDVGMMRPKTPLPAAAYFLAKVPKSNRLYWTNALDVVLARDGQVQHDVDGMSLREQARVMADLNCLLIQAMDYKSDTVDTNQRFIHPSPGFIGATIARSWDPTKVSACERFGDALRDKTGDCEDFGLAIGAQVFVAFCNADFTGHKQLTRLQEIGNQFIAMMTLDTVTAAAAKSDDDQSTAASHKRQLGAHIKCNFFPAIYVKERLDKGIADMEQLMSNISSSIESPEGQLIATVIGGSIKGGKSLPFKPFAPWAKDLPVLTGEGTGMFQTLGVDVDPIQAERVAVYRGMTSLAFAKKTIVHQPGAESTFFVGSMVGFTSYWFDLGANVGGTWLGYSGEQNKTTPGKFQRGVHFKEIVNKSDQISFLPHPPFSDEQMAWMRRATRIRVPPRDLVLTPEGMAKQSKTEPTIDALCTFADSMDRKIMVQQAPVPVFFQSHQLTPAVVNGLKRDIQRDTDITHLSYVCEHFTDWMHVYRVGISANVK